MEWIDVKDDLPKTYRTVLVYLENTNEVWVASYYMKDWMIDEHGQTSDVMFWMEFPKPPKK